MEKIVFLNRFNGKCKCIILVVVTLLQLSYFDCSVSAGREVTANARQVQSLDGRWEIIFDHKNEGREGQWHRQEVFAAHVNRRDISVPSCWEEIEKDYEGVSFYRRTFRKAGKGRLSNCSLTR
jgi:hypothetical protein